MKLKGREVILDYRSKSLDLPIMWKRNSVTDFPKKGALDIIDLQQWKRQCDSYHNSSIPFIFHILIAKSLPCCLPS